MRAFHHSLTAATDAMASSYRDVSFRLLLKEALGSKDLLTHTAQALGVARDQGPADQLACVCGSLYQADWAALQDVQKRTVAALCAVLHSVLEPAVFACTGEEDPRSPILFPRTPTTLCVHHDAVNLLTQGKSLFTNSQRSSALLLLQVDASYRGWSNAPTGREAPQRGEEEHSVDGSLLPAAGQNPY